MNKQSGLAFAFFKCQKPKEQIEKEIPKIRKFAQIPPLVGFILTEGSKNLKTDDAELIEIAQQAENKGMQFILQVMFPGRDNPSAANEAAAFMNQMYNSPLYSDNEQFLGAIFYRLENGFRYAEKK